MRLFSVLPETLLLLLSSAAPAFAADQDGFQVEKTVNATCSRPSKHGDRIAVNYRGTLQATGAEFDASYNRNQAFIFTLGVGKVIKGWDKGLLDMCPGEARRLTIPPEMAYGDRNMGVIPPGSTLIFDTEMVEIIGVKQDPLATTFLESLPASSPVATVTEPFGSLMSDDRWSDATATLQSVETNSVPSMTEDRWNDPTAASTASQSVKTAHASSSVTDHRTLEPTTSPDDSRLSFDHSQDNSSDDTELLATPLKDSSKPSDDGPPAPPAECHLLGPFALLVQGALGAMAILSLVWKRYRETPKRPWKIFFFDVSKQVFGSMLTHILNLAMSMLGSVAIVNAAEVAASTAAAGKDESTRTPNPCSFYLLNLAIDTTIGIPVLYLLLKVLHAAALHTPLADPPASIKSGNYSPPGEKPKATWWLKQLTIYFLGLVGMKLFVFFLFQALPWLPWVGDWALRWTKGNEALEVTFAMFIFPLAMNAVQYWIIDNFIMDKEREKGYEAVHDVEDGDGSDDGATSRLMGSTAGLNSDDEAGPVHHVRAKDVGASRKMSPPGKTD
ncbi:Pfam:DUF3661 [Acrodontium crateriforme]|uniref:peptidylprolyl isomerase n=1 Tax=Acrodontium crateriforme TaxID=150365 RepID=A0AAQ3M491_9PEZI|nr:Pfam:DUF3661 [Acrodontium crateriforme]